jgi:hypothetical protein
VVSGGRRARPDEQSDRAALNVSESTVKTHLLHIYEKLGARTRLGLIGLAIERGWIDATKRPHAVVR